MSGFSRLLLCHRFLHQQAGATSAYFGRLCDVQLLDCKKISIGSAVGKGLPLSEANFESKRFGPKHLRGSINAKSVPKFEMPAECVEKHEVLSRKMRGTEIVTTLYQGCIGVSTRVCKDIYAGAAQGLFNFTPAPA